ncbi:hypothetical protein LTR17_004752 [Elasticomyces elasticus]|nr:hypothetical protein LTR17_004752 [Elasticomyces elasticus]
MADLDDLDCPHINRMDNLVTALQSDRLIKLVIGTKSEDGSSGTLFIWASALEAAAEYFRSALRNQQLGEGSEPDVLTFPEDDFRAWKVMLYWMVKHELPVADDIPYCPLSNEAENECIATWVTCWIMGDKYGIPVFQNLVMIELIFEVDQIGPPTLGIIKFCFENTPPGSLLRELMAEELAMLLATKVDAKKLDLFDGIVGFTSILTIKTLPGWRALADFYRGRLVGFENENEKTSFRYQNFMIERWEPRQHWLHTREAGELRWKLRDHRTKKQ